MNKKIFASDGNKINLIWIIAIIAYAILAAPISWAVTNPNYGTTTFFSEKSEKPSDNPPVYDVGLRSGNKDNGKSNNDSKNTVGSGGTLFDQLAAGVSSLFSGTTAPSDATVKSLFDAQKNSDQNANGDSSGNSSDNSGGEFIMGAKGESYDNMSTVDMENYNNRIANKFSFKDTSSQAAPKKSKLIFTNIIVPVDMTTQYVVVVLAVLIATGIVIKYYFLRKESDRINRKSKK